LSTYLLYFSLPLLALRGAILPIHVINVFRCLQIVSRVGTSCHLVFPERASSAEKGKHFQTGIFICFTSECKLHSQSTSYEWFWDYM